MRRPRFRRIAAWLGGGILVLALAALLGLLLPRHPAEAAAGPRAYRILVLSSAIHTDIALPVDPALLRRFGFLEAAGLPLGDPRVAYILVGRGGRSFYVETPTWDRIRPMPVLRSLGLDAAVLRLALAGPIDPAAEGVRAVELDEAGYARLTDFVLASLQRGPDGAPLLLAEQPEAYGPHSRFFEAEGRFNALWGCNLWTAEALRTGGVTTGLWTPLPVLLSLSLDLHAGG